MHWNWTVADHIGVLLAGLGGIASAVAATAALFAVRRANDTSIRLERLDRARYRHDMTPQFVPEVVGRSDALWLLKLHYVAPLGIERLDSVSLVIRDDMPDRAEAIVSLGQTTKEEVANTIWGPLRFRPGVDKADRLGRAVPGRPLQIGEALFFVLERTMKPRWVDTDEHWRLGFTDPVKGVLARFAIRCEVDGFAWYIPFEEPV